MRIRCYFIFGASLHDADVYAKNFMRIHSRHVFLYHDRKLKLQKVDYDMDRRRNLLIDASFMKRSDIEMLTTKYSGYEFRFVLIGYQNKSDDRIISEVAEEIIRWPDNKQNTIKPGFISNEEMLNRLKDVGVKTGEIEQQLRGVGQSINTTRRSVVKKRYGR